VKFLRVFPSSLTTAALLGAALAFPFTPLVTGCVATRDQTTIETGERPTGVSPEASEAAEALDRGFALAAGTSAPNAEETLKALRDAEEDAPAKEKALIQELRPILTRLVANPNSFTMNDQKALTSLIERAGALWPDDFERQLKVAVTLDQLALVARSLGEGGGEGAEGAADSSSANAAVKRAQTLVDKFPSQARAHGHLGQVLSTTGGDELAAMRSYVRCLSLAPGNAPCKTGLGALAEDWTRPRCVGFAKDRFALHPAWPASSPGVRRAIKLKDVSLPADHPGGEPLKLLMDPRPALTGADVQDLAVLDAGGGEKNYQVWLTPQGAGKFAAVTETLVQEGGHVAILVDKKAVSAPRVMSAIDSGSLQLTGSVGDLTKLCKKMERRMLPDEIAREMK
jgi:hypothetical protein